MTGPLNGLVGFAHALRADGVECGPDRVRVLPGAEVRTLGTRLTPPDNCRAATPSSRPVAAARAVPGPRAGRGGVNPHAGKDGCAPVRSGVVAARPRLDRLIVGHSLDALRHLLEEVSGA
ncbi:hypothetical protein [Saccharothrix sp.]|uniref:hypothetical protein n=1 Tax=Saccharothrix sp. TaxID=1873460 RepID=UPI002810F964|nr:hypothetical protein [Saccharothrix sp.]